MMGTRTFGDSLRESIGENLSFGYCLGFDPIKEFGQYRLDVFPDVACHDDIEEIVARLESSGARFNNYLKNTLALKIFLSESFNFLGQGLPPVQ